MFDPPPRVETAVFARLPERYHLSQPPAGFPRNIRIQAGSFLEGPSFDRAGNLHVVDTYGGRVFRIDADGQFDLVVEYDGLPNGLKIHRDGRIYIADRRNGLMILDPSSGRIATALAGPPLERFRGLNDLAFSSDGDLYFTDQGRSGLDDPTGRLYRLSAAGRLDLLLDRVPSPNGLVLTGDESALYLAVTRGNSIWKVPLAADGGMLPGPVALFIQLSGGAGPDGLALDADGRLVVAHAGLGSVWIFNEVGEPEQRIVSCAGRLTTNVAYGGPGLRSMFITESEQGVILRAELAAPGRPMYSHALEPG